MVRAAFGWAPYLVSPTMGVPDGRALDADLVVATCFELDLYNGRRCILFDYAVMKACEFGSGSPLLDYICFKVVMD